MSIEVSPVKHSDSDSDSDDQRNQTARLYEIQVMVTYSHSIFVTEVRVTRKEIYL